MLFKKFMSQSENDAREVRFMRMLLFWMGIVIIIMLVIVYRLIGSEKTTIVPPTITRSFWVSENNVSAEYLEQMAYWYAGLALNITPNSANYQNELFLKYADPATVGLLTADMAARADFLRKNNIATQFDLHDFKTDTDKLRVALSGNLSTFVVDKKAGSRSVVYLIGFKLINGKLYVSKFKETSDQNPFDDNALAVAK